jgi:hypothetical protein
MIQVTRADDLERQAQQLEAEARQLGDTRAGAVKLNEAYQLRRLAEKLRARRSDGVRFG